MKKIDKNLWKEIKIRVITVIVPLILLLLYVVYHVITIHFIKGQKYSGIAKKQYKTLISLKQKRGNIFDRNMKPLAISIPAYSIYVHPKKLNKKDLAIKILSKHLEIPYNKIFRKIFGKSLYFVYLKRSIDKDQMLNIKKELDENNILGVGFEAESKRAYPEEELAAQIIGFVGVNSKGLTGVEKYYNELLRYKGGRVEALKDAKRNVIELKTKDIDNIKERYSQIVLTIDSFIQYITEEQLKKWVIKSGSKKGVAIVMKSDTGEIYAMAQYPTFDLNNYKESSMRLWKPLGLSMVYEPGSTMKVISIASAINDKVVTLNDKFDGENGSIKLGKYRIRDSSRHGVMTLSEVLQFSSNIGTLKIALKMDRDKFYNYIVKKFHFGKKYDLGIPGQERGLLKPRKWWRDVETANISYGQGISITPIQLITAFSSVINGGKLMKPIIIKTIMDQDKKVIKKFEPVIIHKTISKKTSKIMREMMEGVVSNHGTAPRAKIPGIRTGGKTGTAQKADPTKRAYSDKMIASFIGFFPIEKPLFSILIIMDEPTISNYGGKVAAPPFREIAIKILKYYHKLPDVKEDQFENEIVLPDFRKNLKMLEKIQEEEIEAISSNSGIKKSNSVDFIMPNIIGKNIGDFTTFLEKLGDRFDLIGSGTVYKTDPVAGDRILENQKISIYLKDHY